MFIFFIPINQYNLFEIIANTRDLLLSRDYLVFNMKHIWAVKKINNVHYSLDSCKKEPTPMTTQQMNQMKSNPANGFIIPIKKKTLINKYIKKPTDDPTITFFQTMLKQYFDNT